jgi:Sphingosine kinase and enzymes related to eukaryotic diacylglycerol kinase
MENYFFVNPAAGQGTGIAELKQEISSAAENLGEHVTIYETRCVGDCTNQARVFARKLEGASARFYACGGDGTLNELVNGIEGYDNVAVGCVPIGTGNDTVRSFKKAGNFKSIESQLRGDIKRIDLMKYSGVINGIYQEKLCVNMFNIGFDCNIVELAGRLKSKPLVAGSGAYVLATIGILARKKGINIQLVDDEAGKTIADGQILLCAIANGSYCGGGFFGSPQASMDDGIFDVSIVKDITRRTFLQFVGKYKAGTHLQASGIDKIMMTRKCTSVTLIPKTRNFWLCADGEIELAEQIHFEIVPSARDFIVPAK